MVAIGTAGIKHRLGGAHTARTMMLTELGALIAHCGMSPLPMEAYRAAIVDENILGKRSAKSRTLSFRHLVDLYGLSADELVFAGLLHFWERDADAAPMLAFCAALARDGWLSGVAGCVLDAEEGQTVTRQAVEERIEHLAPERLSMATRKSLAQNINSTFTQSGHLVGRVKKRRSKAQATPAVVAYALLLAYADRARGPATFETLYAKALDCSRDEMLAMADAASRRGFMRFNRVGEVMEVSFPDIVSNADLERMHEQG